MPLDPLERQKWLLTTCETQAGGMTVDELLIRLYECEHPDRVEAADFDPLGDDVTTAMEARRRTVQLDLQHLGQAGLITRDDEQPPRYRPTQRVGEWRALGEHLLINENQILALRLARTLFAAGMTDEVDADGGPLAQALEDLLSQVDADETDRLRQRIDITAQVQFHPVEPLSGAHLRQVLVALRDDLGLCGTYDSKRNGPHAVQLIPIRLTLIHGEWFMPAWDAEAQMVKMYKLARFRGVLGHGNLSADPIWRRPPGTDLDALAHDLLVNSFAGAAGPTAERVQIRVGPYTWAQVRGRTWGADQTVEDLPDGWHRVAFTTKGMSNVRHWVLSFGLDAVVEQPESLRTWVQKQVAGLAERYRPLPVAEAPVTVTQAAPGVTAARAPAPG